MLFFGGVGRGAGGGQTNQRLSLCFSATKSDWVSWSLLRKVLEDQSQQGTFTQEPQEQCQGHSSQSTVLTELIPQHGSGEDHHLDSRQTWTGAQPCHSQTCASASFLISPCSSLLLVYKMERTIDLPLRIKCGNNCALNSVQHPVSTKLKHVVDWIVQYWENITAHNKRWLLFGGKERRTWKLQVTKWREDEENGISAPNRWHLALTELWRAGGTSGWGFCFFLFLDMVTGA